LALLQNNLRRLLAYAVVSHTSIVVIGMFSLNEMAYKGSVMLAINFGLAIATLLFMSGLVYNRTKTLLLTKLGGLFDHIPVIGIAFFIAGLSIMGMPGTPGFDSVHLVLEASMDRFGALVTIAVALGNVVAAGFLLWAFQSAFMSSPPEDGRSVEIARSNLIELVLAGLTLLVLLATGFFSEPLLSVMEHSFVGLEQLYGGHK
jgi:NADH-quinone oxidoreductase subunit M